VIHTGHLLSNIISSHDQLCEREDTSNVSETVSASIIKDHRIIFNRIQRERFIFHVGYHDLGMATRGRLEMYKEF
jgi:hypothetical protein